MTFGAQADANRRAESTTSPEIGFVPSNAFARRSATARRSVMKLTKRPQKPGADPGQPRRH